MATVKDKHASVATAPHRPPRLIINLFPKINLRCCCLSRTRGRNSIWSVPGFQRPIHPAPVPTHRPPSVIHASSGNKLQLTSGLHAAQTFTTSSLICLGSLLIKSISLVWLSLTIFSSLVLYWYWSAMVVEAAGPGRGHRRWEKSEAEVRVSSLQKLQRCDAHWGMPVDSCDRHPGKKKKRRLADPLP